MIYPKFQYRRPPPSYNASIQNFQHQLTLTQNQKNNSTPLKNSQLKTTTSPTPRLPPTDQKPTLSKQKFKSHSRPPKKKILDLQLINHIPTLKITQLIKNRPYQKIIYNKKIT